MSNGSTINTNGWWNWKYELNPRKLNLWRKIENVDILLKRTSMKNEEEEEEDNETIFFKNVCKIV